MLRRTPTAQVRYVCLSWTADGGAVGSALSTLGFKTYTLKTMLSQNHHGTVHPQLWDNTLRPVDEHFDAVAQSKEGLKQNMPFVVKSRLVSQNKMAQKLGVVTNDKLKIDDVAEYDALVGLPVSALEPEDLLNFFPPYTKFILVEETNKAEWCKTFVEEGVVPVLINLRNMMDRSPTGKVWYSLFRHFAFPHSAAVIDETLPSEKTEMIQPKFVQRAARLGGKASRFGESSGGDEAQMIARTAGDIGAVTRRREAAEAALTDFERRVKEAIPADRLYVFRDGDGWEPLVFFTGRDQDAVAALPPFPKVSYGTDFLDQVRFRIVRTQMITKVANVVAVMVMAVMLYMVNDIAGGAFERFMKDAKNAAGYVSQSAPAAAAAAAPKSQRDENTQSNG